jgi:hypothetical protein
MMTIPRKPGPNRKATLLIALLAVFAISMIAVPAQAAAPVTVKVKILMSGPPIKYVPAGDDKAHMLGIAQRTGKAVFSDGRKADYSNAFFLDLYRGQYAKAQGYTKMKFKEGSWLFFEWKAAFVGRDKDGNPMMAGTGKILKGAGAYQGIKGTAKFKNRRLPPSKEFPKGATEANAEFTYTLPAKK